MMHEAAKFSGVQIFGICRPSSLAAGVAIGELIEISAPLRTSSFPF
jgi:hypothetical protein